MAGRRNRKGIAMGGMLMKVRVGIKIEKEEIKGMEGIMELVVRLGEERWKIMGIYVREDLEIRVDKKESGKKR